MPLTFDSITFHSNLFISVSVLCEFAMLPDVYILLSPQEEEVHSFSWGNRCTDLAVHSSKRVKEMRNSFKKWPLNPWWISNKTIMEVGNTTKAAIFKSFLHLSYKNTQLLFFCDSVFQYFHKTNINKGLLGVT